MDEALREQQLRYDEGWRRGLATGKEQRGNLQGHLDFVNDSGLVRSTSRILEIGCGIGTIVADLHRRGFDATGIDISREAIRYGRDKYKDVHLETHAAENLPFAPRSFDLVMSFDVLEHLTGIDDHLAEVVRVLKPRGHYLMQTPARAFAALAETMSHRSLRWRVNHPSLQSPRTLRKNLLRHGFSLQFIRMNPVDEYAEAKLRLPRWFFRAVRHLPWNRLPVILHPHMYVVAEACAS